jgi:hypothetical protein
MGQEGIVGIATVNVAQGPNPPWGQILCTVQNGPGVSASLLYNGYHVFPGGKGLGHGVHQPPSGAKITEIELESYTSTHLFI